MAETSTQAPANGATTADRDTSGPANVAPATEFSPSGAPRQVTEIDVDHPAVDNDPRAHTTILMNRLDFNAPGKTGADLHAQPEQDAGKAKAKA